MWRLDNSKFGKIIFEEYSQIIKLRYGTCLGNTINTRERERERKKERERERERVVAFLFYVFNSLLMFLGSPIFCRIGQFYHL